MSNLDRLHRNEVDARCLGAEDAERIDLPVRGSKADLGVGMVGVDAADLESDRALPEPAGLALHP
jgi:hypothetical protein